MPLTHVLAISGKSQARGVAAGAYQVEALADRDVQRTAAARDANEQRIDGVRKPGALVVSARSSAALETSRRASDLIEVSGVRRKRRVVHEATLAKGSDIPSRRLTPRSVGC
jgi:hypothetical protein